MIGVGIGMVALALAFVGAHIEFGYANGRENFEVYGGACVLAAIGCYFVLHGFAAL